MSVPADRSRPSRGDASVGAGQRIAAEFKPYRFIAVMVGASFVVVAAIVALSIGQWWILVGAVVVLGVVTAVVVAHGAADDEQR